MEVAPFAVAVLPDRLAHAAVPADHKARHAGVAIESAVDGVSDVDRMPAVRPELIDHGVGLHETVVRVAELFDADDGVVDGAARVRLVRVAVRAAIAIE